jgi:hypothetical protein
MATKPAVKLTARQTPARTQMNVFLGKADKPVGRLIFVKDGQREYSQFAYSVMFEFTCWVIYSCGLSR